MFGLGSSSQLGIGIAVTLNDQFSGQAAKVNASLLAMKKNANSAVTGAMRDARNQSAAIAAGALAATAGLVSMVKSASEFDHAINQVFITGGGKLGKTRKQLQEFALTLSKSFSMEPLQIAGALFENAKQGITDGLEEITKYQIAVAAATDENIGGNRGVAANLLNIMNAMDLGIDHFKDVANGVTAVANATQASVYSIGESMQYAAFTAHQFNLPLATTLAMVGKLSQVGIQGTSAGTGINNMLTQMAKGLGPFQSKKQLAAWRMLGLNPKEITAMANSGNITGVISAVSTASSKLTPIQKGSIIPQAFNMRGTRAIEGLFDSKNGNKTIGSILQEAQAGIKGDIAMKQSTAMMNDMFSDFKFFTNALKRFGIAFLDSAGPLLRVIMHAAVATLRVVSAIISSPIGSIFAGIVAVVIPVIGVMFLFRTALFAATIALRGIAGTASIGGIRGLLGGGLNLAGMARFGNNSVVKNKLGSLMISPGTVSSFGQKGGQMLSTASVAAWNINKSRVLGGMGAVAEGAAGAGLMGTIGLVLGRAIPILGGILLAVEVLKMLGLNTEAKNEHKNSRAMNDYYRSIDDAYLGRSSNDSYYNKMQQSSTDYIMNGKRNQSLEQNINISIDGSAGTSQTLSQKLDDSISKDVQFNLDY